MEADVAPLGVGKVGSVMMKSRQGADHANHHRHRAGIPTEALIELHHLFMHRCLLADRRLEGLFLRGIRQLAIFSR
jgi:hypothetical protein